MTLRDFNQLSTTAKAEVIDLWGDLLTEKVIPGHNVFVYQVSTSLWRSITAPSSTTLATTGVA